MFQETPVRVKAGGQRGNERTYGGRQDEKERGQAGVWGLRLWKKNMRRTQQTATISQSSGVWELGLPFLVPLLSEPFSSLTHMMEQHTNKLEFKRGVRLQFDILLEERKEN